MVPSSIDGTVQPWLSQNICVHCAMKYTFVIPACTEPTCWTFENSILFKYCIIYSKYIMSTSTSLLFRVNVVRMHFITLKSISFSPFCIFMEKWKIRIKWNELLIPLVNKIFIWQNVCGKMCFRNCRDIPCQIMWINLVFQPPQASSPLEPNKSLPRDQLVHSYG